jgi:RecA-family ATPase
MSLAPEEDPRVRVARRSAALNGSRPFDASAVEEAPLLPLPTIRGSDFASRELQTRPWLVPDMIPDRTVTLLSGDGGTGKSLLAMQLAVAVAAGSDWIGTIPEPGRSVYVSAEDDAFEAHRRLVDVTSAAGLELEQLADFHLVALAGQDAVLAAPSGRSDITAPTPLWDRLVETVRMVRPRLLVLDNLADAFAGNENSRPQARQFVGMLRGLAIDFGLTVLIIAHPSVAGLNSGSGTSGSTAWSNSVRARLYLDRAKADGEEPDPNLRILKVLKANYAPTGTEVRLRWERGALRLDGGGPGMFDRIAAEAKADRVFLSLLKRTTDAGRDLSPKHSQTFAPTVFAKQPDAEGCSKHDFEKAMERLLASGRIKVEKYGPPSRSYSRIALAEA